MSPHTQGWTHRGSHSHHRLESVPRVLGTKMRLHLIGVLSVFMLASCHSVTFDLQYLCIDQILRTVSSNVSCVEITQYFLDRIRKYNPKINAVITVDWRGAMAQAEKLDDHFRRHKTLMGKLHCVPTLVKDNILVKGLPMTLGLRYFVNFAMTNDAPAVRRLREAGVVILGKANLTPLAMSAPETPSVGGRVWNPHSITDSASSSSNGNAAALAARLSVLGVSSDSSGSTTCPATVTHTVGLRPPIDSLDMSGLFPIRGPSHDTMGLMALSVKDVCIMMQVLSDDRWCGNDTLNDQPHIRLGIIGNLTYGSIKVQSSYGDMTYRIDSEVLPPFRLFESNVRQLNNVSVTLSWDDNLADPYNNVTEHDWDSTCECMTLWMSQFLEENEMRAGQTCQRVNNVTGLLRLAFNGSSTPQFARICEDMLLTEWYCVLFICNFGNWESCNKTRRSSEAILNQADRFLDQTLFQKFDVIVFTQNSHQLLSYSDSQGRTMGDIGSSFAYPALAVPIGFTSQGWFRWDSVPASAYFVTTSNNFHLMMNLAKRYEDRFWNPKMPPNFD